MATRAKPRLENPEDILRAFDRLYELVDGTLVEKALGAGASFLAAELIFPIRTFLQTHKLGLLLGADGASRLTKGLVRTPDLSFIRRDRLPEGGKMPRVPALDLAPDLAVEVLGPEQHPRRDGAEAQGILRRGCGPRMDRRPRGAHGCSPT